VGDAVFVPSVNLTGDVVSIDEADDSAEVQVGGFRLTAGPSASSALANAKNRNQSLLHEPPISRQPPMWHSNSMSVGYAPSMPVSGLSATLTMPTVLACPMCGLFMAKGLGALRQALRDQLKTQSQVKSFEGGGASGGEGVTVVHLKER
jgi:DNA mismatch repair protein MutS2